MYPSRVRHDGRCLQQPLQQLGDSFLILSNDAIACCHLTNQRIKVLSFVSILVTRISSSFDYEFMADS
jgi:hypothetical protein